MSLNLVFSTVWILKPQNNNYNQGFKDMRELKNGYLLLTHNQLISCHQWLLVINHCHSSTELKTEKSCYLILTYTFCVLFLVNKFVSYSITIKNERLPLPVAYFVLEVLLILVILISARDKIPAHTITTDIHDFGHEQ